MQCLFIGGSCNGERYQVPILSRQNPQPIPMIRMPIKEESSNIDKVSGSLVKKEAKYDEYRLETITGKYQRFYIYVEYNMSIDKALSLILGEE